MRLGVVLATVLLAITSAGGAISTEQPTPEVLPTDNYSSVDAVSGKSLQLNVHASATKDCGPASLPTLKLVDRPKNCTFTVRRGTLTGAHVANCENLNVLGLAVFYTSNSGYVGQDHAKYAVIDFEGQITNFDFEITVKEERR
jgi:hypothetical protein